MRTSLKKPVEEINRKPLRIHANSGCVGSIETRRTSAGPPESTSVIVTFSMAGVYANWPTLRTTLREGLLALAPLNEVDSWIAIAPTEA